MEEKWLNEKEASEIIHRTPAALRMARHNRTGPPYHKIGHAVRYKLSDLNRWLEGIRVETRDSLKFPNQDQRK